MTTCAPLTSDLLADGPYVRAAAPYRLIHVHGADAEDFLQRLCTQDLRAVLVGHCLPAAFLDAKGRVVVTCILARSVDGFHLEVQAHQCGALVQLLDHFHFIERINVHVPTLGCFEWTGKTFPAPLQLGDNIARHGEGGFQVAVSRFGVRTIRFHAPRPDLPTSCVGRHASEELWEAVRMGAGFVKVGLETDVSTLALEAMLDDHCSTTKGCFTGQETVARIHTYGHVNRRLCLLHLGDGPAITSPQQLINPDDDLPVGRIMHAVPLAERRVRVGLGYLPKGFWGVGSRLMLRDIAVRVAGFAPIYEEVN
jgi:folate-binding protein YgfZ